MQHTNRLRSSVIWLHSNGVATAVADLVVDDSNVLAHPAARAGDDHAYTGLPNRRQWTYTPVRFPGVARDFYVETPAESEEPPR